MAARLLKQGFVDKLGEQVGVQRFRGGGEQRGRTLGGQLPRKGCGRAGMVPGGAGRKVQRERLGTWLQGGLSKGRGRASQHGTRDRADLCA